MLNKLRTTIASPGSAGRVAQYLFGEILQHTPTSFRSRLYAGDNFFCPICEHTLKKFLTLYRPYHAWCPICWSLQRHRMVWLFFQQNADLFTQSLKFLHVAPENALANRLLNISSLEYLSFDLNDRSAMLKMDITEIKAPDNYFDIIYCSHVLEHVVDDRKAIDELYRVLKPGGWAAIMVPITAPSTIEDPTIIDPVERERLFGQYDHVRRYGLDIIKRLETGGFNVTVITPNDLANQGDINKFGLLESDKIFYCLK